MKYSIDYLEEKKGFEIVKELEEAIADAKENFRYGNCDYHEMLYTIGEKAALVGQALYTEHRFADKDTTTLEDGSALYVDDEDLEDEIRDYVGY